jgi:hypothetical protein
MTGIYSPQLAMKLDYMESREYCRKHRLNNFAQRHKKRRYLMRLRLLILMAWTNLSIAKIFNPTDFC